MNADWAAMRASDADRHRWADIIKTAYAEGRLTLEEYDQRLEQVMLAKTYGDLRQTIADLPTPHPPTPGPFGSATTHSPANQTNRTSAAYPTRRSTDQMALASVILGGLSLLMWLPAVPAVICGHVAMRSARRNEESYGLAFAGTAMGYAALAIPALTLLLVTLIAVG